MSNETLIADIQTVRNVLATRGRTTGTLFDPHSGKVCMIGAIGVATREDFLALAAHDESEAHREVALSSRSVRVLETLGQYVDESPGEETEGAYLSRGYLMGERLWRFNDRRASTTDQDVFDLLDKALANLGGLG